MVRKAKLTEKQWEAIGKRFFSGESARALAKENGNITEAAIRKRFGSLRTSVKDVANQLVAAEKSLKSLPIGSQIAAIDLVANLRSISEHLGSAAEYGAMTAHRLSGLAQNQTEKTDDADPMKSSDTLQSIAVLIKIANSSAEIGLNLLRANSEAVAAMNKTDNAPPEPKTITFVEIDGRIPA